MLHQLDGGDLHPGSHVQEHQRSAHARQDGREGGPAHTVLAGSPRTAAVTMAPLNHPRRTRRHVGGEGVNGRADGGLGIGGTGDRIVHGDADRGRHDRDPAAHQRREGAEHLLGDR